MERSLSILKPDVTAKNVTGAINAIIESTGLRIIAQKRMQLSQAMAEEFYAEHKQRPFFGDLVAFMTSGPVIVQVLEGEDAILKYRAIMGETDPRKAFPLSIRGQYGASIDNNAVHGSDSPESAKREINLLFSEEEIIS